MVVTATNIILHDFWWLVRVTLLVAFGFLPKNFASWQGASSFFLENECSLSGVDNHRCSGHSSPTSWKKIELYAHSGSEDAKTL